MKPSLHSSIHQQDHYRRQDAQQGSAALLKALLRYFEKGGRG